MESATELDAPIFPSSPTRFSPRLSRIGGTPQSYYRVVSRWLINNCGLIAFLVVGVYLVGRLVPRSPHSPFKHLIPPTKTAPHVASSPWKGKPPFDPRTLSKAPPLAPQPKTPVFRLQRALVAADFVPVKIRPSVNDTVIAEIENAASGIWDGTSPYSKLVPDLERIAKGNFDSRDIFKRFFISWANVETGGNFDKDHINVSHQHDGKPETNYGLFQVNDRFVLNSTARHYGRPPNPWRFTAKDMLEDVDANAIIAFNHLVGLTSSKKYRSDFWSALDLYWHGRANNTAYSKGIRRGTIIYYPE